MKKTIKVLTIIFISILAILFVFFATIFSYFFSTARTEKFDKNKLATSNFQIEVYDQNNEIIDDINRYNNQHVRLDTLNEQTKNSFISIEDKNFYSHSGINVKRIGKATMKNILSGKLKEGASTISQQLIKNTHLSNEKTFKRKVKEIYLAIQMEKEMTKDEILESYLNVIYYGNNIYGIENASRFYFSKPAQNLNLEESATLAGIIRSPNNYCPITKKENCLKRRNLVLYEMLKDGYITIEEFEKAKNSELKLNVDENFDNGQNTYSQASIDEACKILSLPTKQIALGGYKIYTYQNPEKQTALKNSILNENIKNLDVAGILINNESSTVEAYYGKSAYSILNAKRQPGSSIKPILVYGPAMNENIIYPSTMILDDEIDIAGYKPQNFNKKYSGYISIRDAVAKSVNIPAVKTLSYIGIDKAKQYAKRYNIEFDKNDNGYALALGGMTYGTNLKTLTNAYVSFANNGIYKEAKFVREIRDKNNKIVYTNISPTEHILREDSNYLTLSTLFESVKNGTAKALSALPYQIASKTGTVGKEDGNTDAYNISLSSEDTVGVWIGSLNNENIGEETGGKTPTKIVKNIFEKIYKTHTPKDFPVPNSIAEVEIDALELQNNNVVVKANDFIPERYKIKEIFSKFNLPKDSSTNFLVVTPANLSGKVENNNIKLEFDAQNYLTYDLYKVEKEKDALVKTFTGVNGKLSYVTDFGKENKASFYLKTKIKNHATGDEIESEPSKTIQFIKSKNDEIKTSSKKWYV